jgi:hypothetical protein
VVLARGLGLEAQLVAKVLGTELMTENVEPTMLDIGVHTFEDLQLGTATLVGLTQELDGFVGQLNIQATEIERDRQAGLGGPLIDGLTRGLP